MLMFMNFTDTRILIEMDDPTEGMSSFIKGTYNIKEDYTYIKGTYSINNDYRDLQH